MQMTEHKITPQYNINYAKNVIYYLVQVVENKIMPHSNVNCKKTHIIIPNINDRE